MELISKTLHWGMCLAENNMQYNTYMQMFIARYHYKHLKIHVEKKWREMNGKTKVKMQNSHVWSKETKITGKRTKGSKHLYNTLSFKLVVGKITYLVQIHIHTHIYIYMFIYITFLQQKNKITIEVKIKKWVKNF